MEKENPDTAASQRAMLEARIKAAPQLVADYVRLAKLMEDSGDRKGAASVIHDAYFFLPNGRVILEALRRLSGWVDPNRTPVTVSPAASPPDPEVAGETEEDVPQSSPALDDELDQLIEGLGNARIGETEPSAAFSEEDWSDEEGLLATETLARIFLSQNQFEEALRVYDRLAEREPNPERAAELRKKAAEVREKLRRPE